MVSIHSSAAILGLLAQGLRVWEVAAAVGCTRRTVYYALAAAGGREVLQGPPRTLTPTFPAAAYTRESRCNHDARPIKIGSGLYCPICHRTGFDWHPRMQARPLPRDRKRYSKGKLKGGR